jgi:leader peptidase (prepilin peptidase)/N-methyltransferase
MNYFLPVAFGLAAGSFANVCILRLPRNASIAFPASHCPRCGKTLRWYDNIPVFGFLLLRGRCRYCRKPISWQYPLVEAVMASLFAFSAYRFGAGLTRCLLFDLAAFYLLTISVIDYRHRIIPDELSLSLLAIGLLSAFWNPTLKGQTFPPIIESATAAFGGGALMLAFAWVGEKIFKKEALGGGDVKLMAAFGSLMGWTGYMESLILGSFLGALTGGVLLIIKRKKPGDPIPYGPFLCLGAFFTFLYPRWWDAFLFP